MISCTTEREVDCACGARLSFWPADVTGISTVVDLALAQPGLTFVGGPGKWRRVITCPCCGSFVEVGGG